MTSYDKIYVFSESKEFITVPDAFKQAKNVIYGGTAFTNDIYVPFENKMIDFTLARPRIYLQFLKDKREAGLSDVEIGHLLDNSYYRWHAGAEELPMPSVYKRHRLYVYDIDFFQEGWRKVMNKMINRNPSSIHFIHPMRYSKISDFLEVRENALVAKSYNSFLNLNIPLKETPILIKHYKNRLLAVITPSSQVFITLGGSFHYQSDYFKDIIYKLNLLYVFWSCNIPLKIKYEEPKLGCYDPISDISKLIATWSQGDTKNYKSIIDRIPKDKSLSERRPEREQLEVILEKYPSSSNLFRQTTVSAKQGGFWKYGY